MESVVVFTGRDVDSMRRDGGSGHWSVNIPRIKKAEFLVGVRNRRVPWSVTDLKHGTAFVIARLSGEIKASPYAGRSVVGLSEYAEINVADAWKKLTEGQRFPVGYLNTQRMLDLLGINIDSLEWKPFEEFSQANPAEVVSAQGDDEDFVGFPIIQAKNQLAEVLGISPDAIEITIRA